MYAGAPALDDSQDIGVSKNVKTIRNLHKELILKCSSEIFFQVDSHFTKIFIRFKY